MTAAGMSITGSGINAVTNDPIGYAIRQCGGSVADITNIVSAEIAGISDQDKFLDIAELRLLENILGNLDDVDIRLGPRSENLSQLATRLEGRVARLQARIEKLYGFGLGELDAGYFALDFADHNEDIA